MCRTCWAVEHGSTRISHLRTTSARQPEYTPAEHAVAWPLNLWNKIFIPPQKRNILRRGIYCLFPFQKRVIFHQVISRSTDVVHYLLDDRLAQKITLGIVSSPDNHEFRRCRHQQSARLTLSYDILYCRSCFYNRATAFECTSLDTPPWRTDRIAFTGLHLPWRPGVAVSGCVSP